MFFPFKVFNSLLFVFQVYLFLNKYFIPFQGLQVMFGILIQNVRIPQFVILDQDIKIST